MSYQMKKGHFYILLIMLVSCSGTDDCKLAGNVDSDCIELELGKFYALNQSIPFSGSVSHVNSDSTHIYFQVKEGLMDGYELISNSNGDTLAYNLYEEGIQVYRRGYSNGKSSFAMDFRNTKLPDSINLGQPLFEKYLLNEQFTKLDSLAKNELSAICSNTFFSNTFQLLKKLSGEVKKVESMKKGCFLNYEMDTLKKYSIVISTMSSSVELDLSIVKDSISAFKFNPNNFDIVPKEISDDVFSNVYEKKYEDVFELIGGTQNRPEYIFSLASQISDLGKLQDEHEFNINYIDVMNGEPIITSEYHIVFLKDGIKEKYRLLVSVMNEAESIKLAKFFITPLRHPLKFE